ncbi:MAG: hypothetical protein QY318_01640 [Candidatus Dojkabacteria bacterium]|nr:MAG: hypothetical protein QY318_01640 [Candidatus Dojkabacteria bacterium]
MPNESEQQPAALTWDQVLQGVPEEKISPEQARAEIGNRLIPILLETEIPDKFAIERVTSVDNSTVNTKLRYLYTIEALRDHLFPAFLTAEHPIRTDENGSIVEQPKEEIEIAPWVNMVHAWTKLLNLANGLHYYQYHKDDPSISNFLLYAVEDLHGFTTMGSLKERLARPNSYYENQDGYYPENAWRESRVAGVNSLRHVNLPEMLYILDTFRAAFARQAPNE